MAVVAHSTARAHRGGVTQTTSFSRYAMTFDETNDQVTSNVTGITVTEPIVFAALFRRTSDKSAAVVGLAQASAGSRWMEARISTDPDLSLTYSDQNNGGWGVPSPDLVTNTWYIGVVQKRNTSPGRIDASLLNCSTGVWAHSSNVANVLAGATTPTTFIIGANNPLGANGSASSRFAGQIAIAAVGNTALEIADIETLWSGTVSTLSAWKALPWKRLVPLNRASTGTAIVDLALGATMTVTETAIYDDPTLGVPLDISAIRPAPGKPVQTTSAAGSLTFSFPAHPSTMTGADSWQVYVNDQAVALAVSGASTTYTLTTTQWPTLTDGVAVNIRIGYGIAGDYSAWTTPAVAMTSGPALLSVLFNGDAAASHPTVVFETATIAGNRFQTPNGSRFVDVANPNGTGTVIDLRTNELDHDAAGTITRTQGETTSFINNGDTVTQAFLGYLPAALPTPPQFFTMASMYGPPFGGTGPRTMQLADKPDSTHHAIRLQDAASVVFWQVTVAADTWWKIAIRTLFATPGWLEIYFAATLDQPFALQTLIPSGTRRSYNTRAPGVNDGGANDFRVNNYHRYPWSGVTGFTEWYVRYHRGYDGAASLTADQYAAQLNLLPEYKP